jgi:hypothetical protein
MMTKPELTANTTTDSYFILNVLTTTCTVIFQWKATSAGAKNRYFTDYLEFRKMDNVLKPSYSGVFYYEATTMTTT